MSVNSQTAPPTCIDDIQFSDLDTDHSYKLYTSVMKKRLAYVNMPQKEFEDLISYEKQYLEFLNKEKFTDLMVIINKKDFIQNWALPEKEYDKLEKSLNIIELKKQMNMKLGYRSKQNELVLQKKQGDFKLKQSNLSINPNNFSQQEAVVQSKPSHNLGFNDFKQRVRMAESKVFEELQYPNMAKNQKVSVVNSQASSQVQTVKIETLETLREKKDLTENNNYSHKDSESNKENVNLGKLEESDLDFFIRAPKSSQKQNVSIHSNSHNQSGNHDISKEDDKLEFSFMQGHNYSVANSENAQSEITKDKTTTTQTEVIVEKNSKKIQTSPMISRNPSKRSVVSKKALEGGSSRGKEQINWNLTTKENIKSTYSLSSARSKVNNKSTGSSHPMQGKSVSGYREEISHQKSIIERPNEISQITQSNFEHSLGAGNFQNDNLFKKQSTSQTKVSRVSLRSSNMSLNSHPVSLRNNVIRIRGDRVSIPNTSNLSDLKNDSVMMTPVKFVKEGKNDRISENFTKSEVHYSGDFGRLSPAPEMGEGLGKLGEDMGSFQKDKGKFDHYRDGDLKDMLKDKDQVESEGGDAEVGQEDDLADNESVQTVESIFDELRSIQ